MALVHFGGASLKRAPSSGRGGWHEISNRRDRETRLCGSSQRPLLAHRI